MKFIIAVTCALLTLVAFPALAAILTGRVAVGVAAQQETLIAV